MALTTWDLTGNITDLLGEAFAAKHVTVTLLCSEKLFSDGGTGARVGNGQAATIGSDGSLSFLDLPDSSSGHPLYRLKVSAKGEGREKPTEETTGWFEMTADRTVAWVVQNSVAVTTVTAAVVAQIDAAVALGATNDTATASFVNDSGSATHAALTATIATAAVARANPTEHAPALGLYFPEAEGAVWDGLTDDTLAIQAAITAAPEGATVVLPTGSGRITAPLSVTKGIRLVGDGAGQYRALIVADACNGVEVAAGVTGFTMQGVEVKCKVRYTTTVNTLVGIKVAGTSVSNCANHIYRDVFVDGFQTAFQAIYLWSSVWDNFRCNNGLIGIDIYGLSVNNFIHDSSLVVSQVATSRCIRAQGVASPTDATVVAGEGWKVAGSLLYGGEIGIEGVGQTHWTVVDNIIDYCQVQGINLRHSGADFGGNWTIANNYIAFSGAAGASGISLGNTVVNAANAGNYIAGNYLLVYSGAACTYGIYASGSAAGGNIITGNRLRGFSSMDIRLNVADNTVTENRCLSAVTNNIYSESPQMVANNVGAVYRTGLATTTHYQRDSLGRRVVMAPAAPVSGAWVRGERVINDNPAVGSPKGWVCTLSGSPGTWTAEANL